MQQTKAINKKPGSLFVYLLLLTSFFMVLELSYFIQRSDLYLGDFQLVAKHLSIPLKILPGVLYFIAVQLGLHLLFTVLIWIMVRGINIVWYSEKTPLILWLLGIFTILVANEYFFSNSKFASLLSWFIFPAMAKIVLIIFSAVLSIAALVALYGFTLVSSRRLKVGVLTLFLLSLGWGLYKPQLPAVTDAATANRPNIILIGIDSLRPDFLSYFGHEVQTPSLDAFFNQSTVFANSLTPIARTFPSWVSILTGEYPKHNGVRFNLPQMDTSDWHFAWNETLPAILRQQGYETVFATDEVRFSNIDERFGFEKIITPPVGFNDFLLGSLNDFPMANLLVNTRLGLYLLPHSYGNRPAFTTYDPNSFLALLEPTLAAPRQAPLFFAVHFCLPHFPYFWGTHHLEDKSLANYQASVLRVDQQFNDLLRMLKKNKLLEHSIVIVLSDHGEAIELAGDRITEAELFIPGRTNKQHTIPHFYPPSFDSETINQSAGHGTDVLGLPQSHTVLAVRLFGLQKNQVTALPNLVSLLDIKPTVLQFLHLPVGAHDDGIGRRDLITQMLHTSPAKDFFMETDYSPQAIRTVHPETRQLLFEGIDFFQIDPKTTHLSVKKGMGRLIISSKQYADLYGAWMLALYPQDKFYMTPILVNLNTGEWTNDLQTSFAKRSPAAHMLRALKQFYGSDITQVREIVS